MEKQCRCGGIVRAYPTSYLYQGGWVASCDKCHLHTSICITEANAYDYYEGIDSIRNLTIFDKMKKLNNG